MPSCELFIIVYSPILPSFSFQTDQGNAVSTTSLSLSLDLDSRVLASVYVVFGGGGRGKVAFLSLISIFPEAKE